MLLEDATSAEQVEAALNAGDEELAEDIGERLWDAARDFERNIGSYVEEELDVGDWLQSDAFVAAVKRDSPGEYDLTEVPDIDVKNAIDLHTGSPWRGIFQVEEGSGGYFSFPVYATLDVRFPEDLVPENAEFIPEEMAEEFWEDVPEHFDVTWDQTSTIAENVGVAKGSEYYIVADADRFYEFARDVRSDYVQYLLEIDPGKAIQMFLDDLGASTAEKVRERIAEDEILDFAHRYLVEGDKSEVEEQLEEFLALTEPSAEPPEVLVEVTQDDLRGLGITQGVLWETAPWRLVRLRPGDLSLEGTRMRHCVGDRSMGYIEAVRDGDIEIWSLRSRDDKPRFTLEVEPTEKGYNVLQLKGKANRLPGLTGKGAEHIKWPEEIVFWEWLLPRLGIHPQSVEDLPLRQMTANPRSFSQRYEPPLRSQSPRTRLHDRA